MKAQDTTGLNEQACMLRFGTVSDYDPARHMARVKFPDRDGIISGWLPVAARNTKSNHDENPLDVDEHVLCLMEGNGTESGAVMCAIYDDTNKPLTADKDTRTTRYDDGTTITYDRANHVLTVDVQGDITIKATGNVKIQGGRIDLN